MCVDQSFNSYCVGVVVMCECVCALAREAEGDGDEEKKTETRTHLSAYSARIPPNPLIVPGDTSATQLTCGSFFFVKEKGYSNKEQQ